MLPEIPNTRASPSHHKDPIPSPLRAINESPKQKLRINAQSIAKEADEKPRSVLPVAQWRFIDDEYTLKSPIRTKSPFSPHALTPKSTPSSPDLWNTTPIEWYSHIHGALLTEEENHEIEDMLRAEFPSFNKAYHQRIQNLPCIIKPEVQSFSPPSEITSPPPLFPSLQHPSASPIMQNGLTVPKFLFGASTSSLQMIYSSSIQGNNQNDDAPVNLGQTRIPPKLSPVPSIALRPESPLPSPKPYMSTSNLMANLGTFANRADFPKDPRSSLPSRPGRLTSFHGSMVGRRNPTGLIVTSEAVVNSEYVKFQRDLEAYFEDPNIASEIDEQSKDFAEQFAKAVNHAEILDVWEANSTDLPSGWNSTPTIEQELCKRKRPEDVLLSSLKLQPASAIEL